MSLLLLKNPRASRYICQSCLTKLARRLYIDSIDSRNRPSVRPKLSSRQKLPTSPARTRFAPSPTGYLHLGSLRTALFNYLLAKSTGGQFLLRIEDTDRKRTVPDAEQRLFDDLRWAGLQWDEGPEVGGPYGPYKQSERTPIYREHADKLLQSDHAYRCFCTAQRLNELAEQRSKLGLPTDYDRTCANIAKDQSDDRAARGEVYVVRLRVPDHYPEFTDIVYGKVGRNLKPGRRADDAYEDPVLLKSDGLPTYHLANVVDDHHMRITHVVRGTEWLPATAKHLAMYNAFGWTPPEFAHVGLLVDEAGNKLSKRNFDVDIASFRDKMGIFPEALTNFVALLGWSHQANKDLMTMEELIERFSLKFTKGDTTVTLGKLWFLQNKHAINRVAAGGPPFDEMVDRVVQLVSENYEADEYQSILSGRSLRDYVASILRADAKNYTTPDEFTERNSYFLRTPDRIVANLDTLYAEVHPSSLDHVCLRLEELSEEDWNSKTIKAHIVNIIAGLCPPEPALDSSDHPQWVQRHKAVSRTVQHYFRARVSLGKQGPGMADTMEILGRKETLRRMCLPIKPAEGLPSSS